MRTRRNTMSKFAPASFEEAIENRRARPQKPRKPMSRGSGLKATLRSTAFGRELAEWGREVKKRDGNRCQWPNCGFCKGSQEVTLDPHHKALRSARPDLRLILTNGITVCRRRHNWIHSPEGHSQAVKRGFLNERSRELAAKEGTLGIY